MVLDVQTNKETLILAIIAKLFNGDYADLKCVTLMINGPFIQIPGLQQMPTFFLNWHTTSEDKCAISYLHHCPIFYEGCWYYERLLEILQSQSYAVS